MKAASFSMKFGTLSSHSCELWNDCAQQSEEMIVAIARESTDKEGSKFCVGAHLGLILQVIEQTGETLLR